MHRRMAATVLLGLAIVTATGCAPDPPLSVVAITTTGCPPGSANGSGTLVAPGLVLTAAHVVKGGSITVTIAGRSVPGEVVAFDPEMDLAYLHIGVGGALPMPVGGWPVERGDAGVAYVVRDGETHQLPITVRRPINLRTEDIYIEGTYDRPAWELDAAIEHGDSGGPVVVNGRVIGVLSLRSSKYEARAYAIDPVKGGATIRSQLERGEIADTIDPTRCT